MPDLRRRLGRNRAGQSEFLLTERLLQFSSLDQDQIRIGGEPRVEQCCDFGAEVSNRFLLRFKIENSDTRWRIAGPAWNRAQEETGRNDEMELG